MKLIQKVKKFIVEECLVSPNDTVVMGVSGGADSVCLLMVLSEISKEMNLKLVCVSINHGLREEAYDEVEYVKSLCVKEKIDFMSEKIDVISYSKETGFGTEEAARILRYKVFDRISSQYAGSKIAVAHNLNDVSETFLFNLFRGTGPKGLGSMRPKRDNVIRPLLCVERAEIEEYLSEKGIRYCTDKSNLTDDYSRNKIRHHILEYAKEEINPKAISHIGEAANLIRKLNDIVESQAEEKLTNAILEKKEQELILAKEKVLKEDPYIANIMIKKCIDILAPGNKDITSVHLDSVREMLGKTEMKMADLPYDIRVTSSGNKVSFKRGESEEKAFVVPIFGDKGEDVIPGFGRISWHTEKMKEGFDLSEKQYTKCFDYDKITDSLLVRFGAPDDEITINEKLQKKKLFEYLKNEKVPQFERKKTWVLADENRIWWVIGRRIGELAKVSKDTKKVLVVEIQEDKDGQASC